MSTGRRSTGRPEDSAVAWFVVLERARQVGDGERAAEAQKQLERLGVKVIYEPVQRGSQKNGRLS